MMDFELKLKDVVELIQEDVEVVGNPDVNILGIASLDSCQKGDLSFLQSKKFIKQAESAQATVLIVPTSVDVQAPGVDVLIRAEIPSRALSQICGALEQKLFPVAYSGVHSTAQICDGVTLSETASVGAFSTLEADVVVGQNSKVGARVTVGAHSKIGENVIIGDNVVLAPYTVVGNGSKIHSGVVIGTPGFGYDFNKELGCHQAIPQIGRVIIGENVDVGANTTIDRARFGDTVIGDGTKIDNLVQIAHNVIIGKHCIICSGVGISGTVKIGDYVVLAGQVGVADHVEIASGTQVGGGAGITSNVKEPGKKIWGTPAIDYGLAMKTAILQKRIPELFKRVKEIEKQIQS